MLRIYFVCRPVGSGNRRWPLRHRWGRQKQLYATVRPDRSQNGYHIDLSANIPLEMEGDKPGAYDMCLDHREKIEHHAKPCIFISAELRENKLAGQTLLFA